MSLFLSIEQVLQNTSSIQDYTPHSAADPPPPNLHPSPSFTPLKKTKRVSLNTLQYSKEQKMYKTKMVLYGIANGFASAFM